MAITKENKEKPVKAKSTVKKTKTKTSTKSDSSELLKNLTEIKEKISLILDPSIDKLDESIKVQEGRVLSIIDEIVNNRISVIIHPMLEMLFKIEKECLNKKANTKLLTQLKDYIINILQSIGIEEFTADCNDFYSPMLHEIVQEINDNTKEDMVIIEVKRNGFKLSNGRIIAKPLVVINRISN